MGWADTVLDLLFPPRCLGCNRVVPIGEDCCPACRKEFQQFPPPGEWEGRPVVSLWTYLDRYPVAVRRLKFRRDYPAGKRMARLMAAHWRRQLPRFGEDLITFVPMPEVRERMRGGNQAELLARWIGAELRCPTAPLLRRDGILTQHQLPASFRYRMIGRGFSLLPGVEEQVRGKRIILVDDLITTGATIGTCARLLEQAGAAQTALLSAVRADPARRKAAALPPQDS